MTPLEQFDASVAEVRVLFDLRSDDSPPETNENAKNNALFRASVVLLVSHFESFLRLLAEDFIDALSTGALESRKIPHGIRELHTVPKLAEIIACNDETQRAVLLKKLHSSMSLWHDDAKPSPGTLSTAILTREITNGHSDTIDGLFALMGSKLAVCDGDLDVPADDGGLAPTNIRLALRDVIQCRNDIAHGDKTRKPTEGDVTRYITFLSALATRLQSKASALASAVGS